MRTAEPSPPGEERGIEIGRGRGGGGGLTLASAHAHTHTHTHTSVRASQCHSNTRRCAAHTQAHAHALSPRHTPAGRDAGATHSPEAFSGSHTTWSCRQRRTEMPTRGEHAGVKNAQTRRHIKKHICPSDTQGLRQPKTSEAGVVEQNRDKTHSGTDTHQGTSSRGTHINTHTQHL